MAKWKELPAITKIQLLCYIPIVGAVASCGVAALLIFGVIIGVFWLFRNGI